jgi:uncharacterized NAD-dependent epimerase/dehydratase family protein
MTDSISGTAVIITNGALKEGAAKTAHGLIRGTDRFKILAVIDEVHAGKDAGETLDGIVRNIPVFATLSDALAAIHQKIDYCLVGIAPKGGKLPADMITVLKECLNNNIGIVSGLHEYVSDIPELAKLAKERGVTITDVRKPKGKNDLHFWSGKIAEVTCPVIAVLGMDTKMGKRTTTRFMKEACNRAGIHAEMVSTGQTGWMQDGRYGFVLDSVYNDFVSGELEHAIYSCFRETHPDVIFLEGQSGLRNPSGPCGAEYIVSGRAKYVILQHSPKRIYYDDNPRWGKIPSVKSEIELIELYGAAVIAVTLNTENCTRKETEEYKAALMEETGIPVVLPLEEGVAAIIPVIKELIEQSKLV